MTVAELRAWLATLPEEMPVLVHENDVWMDAGLFTVDLGTRVVATFGVAMGASADDAERVMVSATEWVVIG